MRRSRRGGPVLRPSRIPVAVLGATGVVGRRLVGMLEAHPWLDLAEVAGSDRRAGAWLDGGRRLVPADRVTSPLVLSALPASAARALEPALAARGHVVCTNASALRMAEDVPLIVPEVNPEALRLLEGQRWADAGGAVIANPNCVASGLAPVLSAIDCAFGLESGSIVTLQALSGAGAAGLSDATLAGNVVPHIDGEEDKIAAELGKILGRPLALAVTVNRVPVAHGHLAHVFLRLAAGAAPDAVAEALTSFRAPAAARGLPTLPDRPIHVLDGPDRPQPRLDRDLEGGMGIAVGRIRSVPGYDVALTVLSHNLVRGAAGACVAVAELWAAARSWAPGAPTGSPAPSAPGAPSAAAHRA